MIDIMIPTTIVMPGPLTWFGNSADEYLKVHREGATEADVTEGSGGIWERLRRVGGGAY
jgi:hypothetical protein